VPNSAAGAKVPAGKQGRSIGESSPGGVSLQPDLAAVIAPSTPGRLCQQWKAAGADAGSPLELLAKGTSDERSAMAWLVNQVNRFGLSMPNTRSPISGCTRAPMPPEP
jgi:hypothetical protein